MMKHAYWTLLVLLSAVSPACAQPAYVYIGLDGKTHTTTDLSKVTTTIVGTTTQISVPLLTDVQKSMLTAINTNATSLASEITRAKAAEAALATTITPSLTYVLKTSINQANGVAGLDANSKVTSAILGDVTSASFTPVGGTASVLSTYLSTVSTSVSANTTAITSETTRATNAEQTNATTISNNTTAISTEKTRAQGAETTLTTNLSNEVTRATTAEGTFALKASPTFTGTPTAPTPAAGDNSTKLATTNYADRAVASEATTARSNESTNATNITNETTRAKAAEATNATAITAAQTTASAAIPKASINVAGGTPSLNSQNQVVQQSALPTIKPFFWQSTLPFWGALYASAQSTQLTSGMNFSVDGQFTAIQLIFANPGSSVTLPAVRVASSASNASLTTPVDSSGNTMSWTTVTSNGSSSITLPAGTLAQPALSLSDVIPMQSLTRTDGGTFSLVYTRTLSPATGTSWTPNILIDGTGLSLSAYNTAAGGRNVGFYYGGGDFASSQTVANVLNDSNATTTAVYTYVAGIRYLSPNRVVTIMGCGDSLTAGFKTTSGYDGFGLQAAVTLANNLGIGVSYVAHGYPSQSTPDILANCKAAADLLKPAVVTFPIDSPNDWTGVANSESTTAAAALTAQEPVRIAMQMRALDMANTVDGYGGLPVIVTPIPFAGYDAANTYGSERVLAGNFARALSTRGGLVLDAQSIISGYTPTTSNLPTLPSSCLASDNAHLNDTCQGTIATSLVTQLTPRL